MTSHSFDYSTGNISNLTQRTISSSSIISTPSNTIRRVQQKQGLRVKKNDGLGNNIQVSGVSSTANASKKLLNLQQLKKTYASPKAFVLRKPINMSKYDYTVFTRHQESDDVDEPLPPPIKDSQIRAWELAEKISANIIFDHAKTDAKDGDDDSFVADEADTSIVRGEDGRTSEPETNIIASIPGYTKGELQIVLESFGKLQWEDNVDLDRHAEEEQKALWVYRQQQSAAQEKAFVACHTLSGKRKVQVFHKKEFLHKLFGYSNNVNHEYITNNTSYSAFDNVQNAQKVFHEDKEEIFCLLEEEKAFEEAMAEAKDRLVTNTRRPLPEDENEHSNMMDVSASWLSSFYNRQSDDEYEDAPPETVASTLAYLKLCVKDASEVSDE